MDFLENKQNYRTVLEAALRPYLCSSPKVLQIAHQHSKDLRDIRSTFAANPAEALSGAQLSFVYNKVE